MAVVLLTGMSGVGKSTVLAELGRRGHRVVDTDEGDWVEQVAVPGWDGTVPHWRVQPMTALLDDHDLHLHERRDGHRSGHLFLAGTVANQGVFADRFTGVVLLTVPVQVALRRIATRTTNRFGRAEDERRRIVADFAHVEPLLRRCCAAARRT